MNWIYFLDVTCGGARLREAKLKRLNREEFVKPEELTDKAIDYILGGLENANLNEWELNFYESVSDQWTRNRRLSERQKEILGQIWDKY